MFSCQSPHIWLFCAHLDLEAGLQSRYGRILEGKGVHVFVLGIRDLLGGESNQNLSQKWAASSPHHTVMQTLEAGKGYCLLLAIPKRLHCLLRGKGENRHFLLRDLYGVRALATCHLWSTLFRSQQWLDILLVSSLRNMTGFLYLNV